jgi:hypothetical protein
MNAWDVEGQEPGALIGRLREAGLTGCSLGLSYHGGRMLLGRNAGRVVYEQRAGAVYFEAEQGRFPAGLRPEAAGESRAAMKFLEACGREEFDAQAWLVLCHNDALGDTAPECSVENAFGERYGYALCPAQEKVQEYCVEMCRQAAAVPGVSGLDVEALGWLGYEHQGLHEKRGVPLTPEAAWWLSICCCEACRAGAGEVREAVRERVRAWLADPWRRTEAGFDEVVEWRAAVQARLLGRIREAAGGTRLNVRLSQERRWSGGKCTLGFGEVAGSAEEATVTYFGAAEAAMEAGLRALPAERGIKLNGGVVFHAPDCGTEADVMRRLRLLQAAGLDGWGFYSYGMAVEEQWRWLSRSLARIREEGETR